MIEYENQKCRRCKHGDKYEHEKPCITIREDCKLFEPIAASERMTNREKFKEVFGFEVDPDILCIASPKTCEIINKITTGIECEDCPFYKKWADAEYKPCFELGGVDK